MWAPSPGVLDIRGRRDFSRFDPSPGRPHFSKSGPPVDAKTFFIVTKVTMEELFVDRRHLAGGRHFSTLDGARSQVADFSRFGAHLLPGAL